MNNKWFAQCVFLVCHRWGRMFVLMIFAPGYVDWGWIFSETSWRVQCGSLAWCLWSSAGMYGLYGIITQQTCHAFCACVCFFGYQLSKFGKQTFESRRRNVCAICHLQSCTWTTLSNLGMCSLHVPNTPLTPLLGNCTTLFTCTAVETAA